MAQRDASTLHPQRTRKLGAIRECVHVYEREITGYMEQEIVDYVYYDELYPLVGNATNYTVATPVSAKLFN